MQVLDNLQPQKAQIDIIEHIEKAKLNLKKGEVIVIEEI